MIVAGYNYTEVLLTDAVWADAVGDADCDLATPSDPLRFQDLMRQVGCVASCIISRLVRGVVCRSVRNVASVHSVAGQGGVGVTSQGGAGRGGVGWGGEERGGVGVERGGVGWAG